MLRRALVSVLNQTFRDFVWVIVNDGGDKDEVDNVINSAKQQGLRVQTIHNSESLGMEAASNCGIRGSTSEFLVIHDDDDTWDPDFLAATTAFLDAEPCYCGVVTHTNRVDEVIEGGQVRITRTTAWNHQLMSVYLIEMAQVNSFPPISFLFRRSVLADIGLFDESLPVLGDWDFHLRFLTARDIGVVPRPLAFYHHRESTAGAYGNSLYDGVSKHIRYDALLRNRMLRRDLEDGRLGLGLLVNLARTQNGLSMLETLMHTIRRIGLKTGLLKLAHWLAR
jgi:glycosyltransferase involved in cell wall biosynthesis